VEVVAVQDDRVDFEDEEPPEVLKDETQVMYLNTFARKIIPEVGELFLRYTPTRTNKTQDFWIGSSTVKGLNLETMKTAVGHKNELKLYMRPDARSWKTDSDVLSQILDEFKILTSLQLLLTWLRAGEKGLGSVSSRKPGGGV
jgi:hypothetical protein